MSRFLFISTLEIEPWGGSEELWVEAAERLAQEGHEVRACVQAWDPPAPKIAHLQELGAEIFFRRANPWGSLAKRVARKLTGGGGPPGIPAAAAGWIAAKPPNLTLISMGNYLENPGWMDHCRRAGRPFAVIPHSVDGHVMPDDSQSQYWADLYAAAKRVFVVCERNKENLRRQLATAFENLEIVRNPINVRRDASAPWPKGETVKLATIGRLEPMTKGQDLILEAMSLPKWRERDIRLSVFGSGPCERTLKRLAKMFRLENVSFEGSTQDVESVWANHHALVVPSRVEGLPLVVVEAMHMARPCIVTDVNGAAELLDDGQTGFVAAAPTVKHLDEALERAWQARASWPAMGQAARETVLRAVPDDPAAAFAHRLKALL